MFAVVTATIEAEEKLATSRLAETAGDLALEWLDRYPRTKWSIREMAANNIGTFGHKTSNCVEGHNGVVVKLRAMHPLKCADEMVVLMSARLSGLWCGVCMFSVGGMHTATNTLIRITA